MAKVEKLRAKVEKHMANVDIAHPSIAQHVKRRAIWQTLVGSLTRT